MLESGILGTPRKANAHDCSKCGVLIPENHIALTLFADGRNLRWLYCEKCEEEIIFRLYKQPERKFNGEKEIQAG